MTAAGLLALALLVEIALRVAVEIREVRMTGRRIDKFAVFRILPFLNDLFPAEVNFPVDSTGAFAKAHEKAHAELHHGAVRRLLVAVFAVAVALGLSLAGMFFRLNLLELLIAFHLAVAVFRVPYHALCFAEEYEADRIAAKRVQRGVALRGLQALEVVEFPRTQLFALLYRTHPTASMRRKRLTGKGKRSPR